MAAELIKCQLDDGYLGTYLDKDRWTEWDVWAHKYNLIGLITYMRYTGNLAPLPACRRMADLLCNTFGDEPGKRDIIKAGQHVGMAPTSVLEPMVLLYRLTGEPRYLDFCKYILRAWEQPNGPKIISTLLTAKRVDKVGNGKAYEMLSCLNGALEYLPDHRASRKILEACLNAWQDIVRNRLYLTGAASYGEFFHDDFDLPNVANVGETCVTVTWLQFNAQLLRLTGEARFAEQLERVVLNQLFGAQRCDGSAWGYYVQMEGKKPYSSTLDGHCCLSSGPRGVALIPTFAVTTDADGVVVNLYDAGTAKLKLRDGTAGRRSPPTRAIRAMSGCRSPWTPPRRRRSRVKLRIPAWCPRPSMQVNGKPGKRDMKPGPDGYWRRHAGMGEGRPRRAPVQAGTARGRRRPQEPGQGRGPLRAAGAGGGRGAAGGDESQPQRRFRGRDEPCRAGRHAGAGARTRSSPGPAPQVFRVNAIARKRAGDLKAGAPLQVRLIPFADAGGTGTPYKVWLPLGLASSSGNVLLDGQESRSRMGNVGGSIIDEDLQSFVVTFNDKPRGGGLVRRDAG